MSGQPARGLRLLYLGPFNSPHVEDLALAMRERGHVVEAAGEQWGGLPASSLDEGGVPTHTMRFPTTLWLRRLVRDFRPDVVHAHWMPFAALAALAGARPLVASAWGSDVYGASRRHLLLIRLALRRASVAMSDSVHLLARLEELGGTGRTMLVNWGVDLGAFRVPSAQERAELKVQLGLSAAPVVFSPRGLKELYNPDVVVAAFARVREAMPGAQLVLKHLGSAESVPLEWRELPGVTQVGHVAQEAMARLFRAADVTVSVPRTDSSPRSVWEAMAAGSATVLSDLPWVHELVADGRDALVVEPRADTVAAAIEQLLRDEGLRGRLVASARALVEGHRDREVELERVETCYRRLADSRS